jgi:2'-5' RNA ligase
MGCETNGHVRVNQYALVSYIEEPLGSFLDRLRLRLAPGCRPHAHVTILPPRPLRAPEEQAEAVIRDISSQFHAFAVQLGAVKLFEASEVIYIEVDCGSRELRQMHQKLNAGPAQYDEPFEFHPHITLAQNLPHEHVAETLRQARQFWSEWRGKVVFPVDELSFVQNTEQNCWLDLMHVRLSHEPAEIVR